MESNTFATSAYIWANEKLVFEYLCDLENLNEWTLFSRMKEQVDKDTWFGTASGYQAGLYYHIRKNDHRLFKSVEWHCGFEVGKYFQVYPVFLFPSGYVERGSRDAGVYFHWVSFVDPAKRTKMIEQGIGIAHTAECRSLKGILDRKAGVTAYSPGRYRIKSDTIYIDAPVKLGAQYLGDVRNMTDWAHLLRREGEAKRSRGKFRDEYGHVAEVSVRVHTLENYYLLEQDSLYAEDGILERAPALLIPCSYAFGNPAARGFLLHRMTFWERGKPRTRGKVQLADYQAESINMKRLLEAKAGNMKSFARGLSYIPD